MDEKPRNAQSTQNPEYHVRASEPRRSEIDTFAGPQLIEFGTGWYG